MTDAATPTTTEATEIPEPTGPTAAIILAGGRASRLGGTAKPLLEVGGRTLLDRAISAVDGCEPIVVVGPQSSTRIRVVWTRETPDFGGPVAGIVRGLALVDTAEVMLLAADLPHAESAVALLRQHPSLPDGPDGADGAGGSDGAIRADGVCLTDDAGRMQWLAGRYRTAALRASAAALPDGGRDASMRSLLAHLSIAAIPAGALAADVDTWDDLERAHATASTPRATASTPPRGSARHEEMT
nr:NTP transferase domain-containing protein [Microbacterium hydrocarbonoxydans]